MCAKYECVSVFLALADAHAHRTLAASVAGFVVVVVIGAAVAATIIAIVIVDIVVFGIFAAEDWFGALFAPSLSLTRFFPGWCITAFSHDPMTAARSAIKAQSSKLICFVCVSALFFLVLHSVWPENSTLSAGHSFFSPLLMCSIS